MLKKLVITSLLFIAVLLMPGIAQFCLSLSQNPGIIRVPDDYPTIQEAVDAASPGDTLLVAPGVYYENVVVNKPLRLVGEDRNNTIIDGGGYNWDRMTKAISVLSGNVTIEGFTIKNAFFGIYAEGVDGLILQDLILTSNSMGVRVINTHAAIIQKSVAILNTHGIFVEDSSMCIIKDNTLANNWCGYYPNLLLGGGINLVRSNNSIVANNFLTEHRVATIELAEAYGNIVANNTTVKNGHGGIELHGSHENLIVNNTSIEDETGVYIGGGSTCNFVIGNFASEGGVSGIAVISSTNNFYTKNILSNKYAGFCIETTCDIFVDNLVANNTYGVIIHFSNGSVFHHNNFVNNTVAVPEDVYANFNVWDDGFEGNYWDSYKGTDADQDGIGDSPYIIDQYNRDNHPLMGIFSNFTFTWQEQKHSITTISNSTITNFQFDSALKKVSINVIGETKTLGFCRITIPNTIVQDLWSNNYTVLVDEKEPLTLKNWTDGKNTFIYITYQLSQHTITIIPEFQPTTLLIFIPTIAFAIAKKKHLKHVNRKMPLHTL